MLRNDFMLMLCYRYGKRRSSLGELDLPAAGDDLFAGDVSPTFDKPLSLEKTIEDARFIAQHVKNKDKFENVSILIDGVMGNRSISAVIQDKNSNLV